MAKDTSIDGGPYTKPAATPLTKMQEDASLAVIRMAFQRSRKFTEAEIVGNGKTIGSRLQFKAPIRPNVSGVPINPTPVQEEIFKVFPSKHMNDYVWLLNFYKQQAKFFSVSFGGKPVTPSPGGYEEFDRDSADGFMTFIEKIVKDNFKISKKDVWNPADIWLIWDKNKARAYIESSVAGEPKDIGLLNAAMRKMLKDHEIVGISLKKISGKEAKWQILNLAKKFQFIGPGPPKYEWANRKARCKCKLVTGKFTTGEKGLEWYRQLSALEDNKKFISGYSGLFVRGQTLPDGLRWQGSNVTPVRILAWQSQQFEVIINENRQAKYELPIKSGHTGGAKGDKLSFEPVDVHARAARLGKAEATKVVELFAELGSSNARTFNKWQDYPSELADWNTTQRSKYAAIVNRITPWVETGVTGKEFVQNVATLFKQVELVKQTEISQEKLMSDRLRYSIVAKLMQLVVANMLWNLNQRNFPKNREVTMLEVWLTKVAFMAQKKGPGFGPFGKLY